MTTQMLALPPYAFHDYYERVAEKNTPLGLLCVPAYLAQHKRYSDEDFCKSFSTGEAVYNHAECDAEYNFIRHSPNLRTVFTIPQRIAALKVANPDARKDQLIQSNIELFWHLELAKYVGIDPIKFAYDDRFKSDSKYVFNNTAYYVADLINGTYKALSLL